MLYILVIVGAYLLGCSNMALYISRIKKVDPRAGGSGNLGASNATALMGWRVGIVVAIHDIGKATLAVILARAAIAKVMLNAPAATMMARSMDKNFFIILLCFGEGFQKKMLWQIVGKQNVCPRLRLFKIT